MNCETRHIHNRHCLDWLDEHCCLSTGCNMIFYFMGDFGRARLWTGAMKLAYLAPRLYELDTAVVLVGEAAEGNEARIGAAARLAEDLRLPFPLIADSEHILWHHYMATSPELAESRAGLILVDGRGRHVCCWPLQAPQQRLDLPALLATLEDLATQ